MDLAIELRPENASARKETSTSQRALFRSSFSGEVQRLGGGVQLVDKAASLYLKTDWSGVEVVFSPGVLLAHPSDEGQPLENEHISLFGVNTPPDGFYYSYPLFHYGIPQ